MEHDHHDGHSRCHHIFKIAKLVLQAATVAAGLAIAQEIHRVHRSIEARNDRKR